MALFGGGKKAAREAPVDRVRVMMRGGMSEKDIVRQLKAEGYSFNEIEKALMEVVKTGAAPLPSGAELGMSQRPAPAPVTAPKQVEAKPMPAEAAPPQPMQTYGPPSYEPYQQAPAYPELTEEELQPEVIMEELIESVSEEKFEKFSTSIKRIEEALGRLHSQILSAREKAEEKPAPEMPKELGDRLDAMEVRIGGLEKAFRQLLPSLQDNIQAISRLVAEKRRAPQF